MTDSTDNARGPERIWAESKTCTVDASGASRLLAMDREFSRGTEYIRADLPATDALGAAKVKPLVWVERTDIEGLHEAASPIGWYYNITAERDGQFRYEGDPALATPIPLKYFPTLEAAKSAAQADYETRICSALEPCDPLADARVLALVDAVERWADHDGEHGYDAVVRDVLRALAAFDTTDTGDKADG